MKFIPKDATKSEFDCSPGEIAYTNARNGRNGLLQAPPVYETMTTMPEGGMAVAMHRGMLLWYYDGTYYYRRIADNADTLICTGGKPITAEICGDIIVVSTDDGIRYFEADAEAIQAIATGDILPHIDFRLHRETSLVTAETVATDTKAVRVPTAPGMSAPHPATGDSTESWQKASTAILSIMQQTIGTQAHGRGLFTSPFMVRYALRSHGGEYIAVSSPRLMLPTVLPPCIGIGVSTSADTATLSVDLSHCHGYRLEMRAASAISDTAMRFVTAIDILATPQIPTYTGTAGGIATYGSIVAQTNTGGANRGRENVDNDNAIFDGRYSIDGTTETDHTLTDTNMQVLAVYPNPRLCHDITTACTYYKVAEIPLTLLSTPEYTPVEIENTSPEAISRLQPINLLHILDPADMSATALLHCGDRLLAAISSIRMPYIGHDHGNLDICVYAKHGGVTCCRRGHLDRLPRMLYVTDAEAYLAVVRDGTSTWSLPLTRHIDRRGAYWFGGLDLNYIPSPTLPSAAEPPVDCADTYPAPDMVAVSRPGWPWVFDSSDAFATGATVTLAMHRAVKDVSQSRYGRTPVYLFTDRGILMPQYDTSADRASERYHSCRLLSDDVPVSANALAVAPDCVVYLCGNTVKTVSGTKISTLRRLWREPSLSALPHFTEIFGRIAGDIDFTDNPVMTYHEGCICLSVVDNTLHIPLTEGEAGRISGTSDTARIPGAPPGWVISGTKVVCASEALTGVDTVVVTRPIRTDREATPWVLKTASILGHFDNTTSRIMVYASDDCSHWHAVASARGAGITVETNDPHRYHIIAVAAVLRPGDTIYGVTVDKG